MRPSLMKMDNLSYKLCRELSAGGRRALRKTGRILLAVTTFESRLRNIAHHLARNTTWRETLRTRLKPDL